MKLRHMFHSVCVQASKFMWIYFNTCRLVSLVSDESSSRELISEAIITLGSFAHGE